MIGTAWSLLPPVVAIALALKTKEVYSSLFIGIILGAVQYCISMGTGFDGFLVHLTNHTVGEGDDAKAYGLIHCLSDPWNVGILVFLVVLGSIVSLMNKAGGSAAFGRWASKHVKSKMGVQIATILLGILIFIDDYFNCLTVGSVMRPIAVRNGVTRKSSPISSTPPQHRSASSRLSPVGQQPYRASYREAKTDWHSSARRYLSISTPSSPSSSCWASWYWASTSRR